MTILGVRVDNLPKLEVLAKIRQLLLSDEIGKQLVTTNPEFILTAQNDEKFCEIINNSWLSVPDGYGLRLAAKYLDLTSHMSFPRRRESMFNRLLLINYYLLLGAKIALWGFLKKDEKLDIIKETITGTDLVGEIVRIMNQELQIKDKKIFLLGGFGDTPRLVMENLKKNVIPSPEGAMESLQFDYSVFETENIIEKINSFQPVVLFVALNHPKAQKWIDENLPKMPSIKLAVGVGGAFDYWAGKIKRAPTAWQGSYEWMYRLFHQPKRLKRIWQASVSFPWKVFKNSQRP